MRDACECMGLNTPGDVGLVTQQQHRLATLLLGLCYYRLFSVLQSHTLSADVVGPRPATPTNRGGGGGSFQGISIAVCRGEGVVFLTDSLQVSTGGFGESKGEARQDSVLYFSGFLDQELNQGGLGAIKKRGGGMS